MYAYQKKYDQAIEAYQKAIDLDKKFEDCLNAGILPGIKLNKFHPDADKNLLLTCFTELNDCLSIDELVGTLSDSKKGS